MDNLTRFLQRNAFHFAGAGPVWFVNPPAGFDPNIPGAAPSHIFCQDFAVARALRTRGHETEFGTFPQIPPEGLQDIVLVRPREKALLRAWIDWSRCALSDTGRLWLAGENRGGIKSSATLLQSCFGSVEKKDSARHCGLFEAREPLAGPKFEEAALYEAWSFELHGRQFRMQSAPGVFAHGHLDPGSRLLLETLENASFSGRALDFGCGAGVLSVVLAVLNPELHLTLLDNNALALESARRSLVMNDIEAQIVAADGLSELDARYDLILSNPPFHQGVLTRAGMSMDMLQSVRNFLNPGGQLLMVVNRHLPYREWLNQLFGQHELVDANSRYQVLRARLAT
jgi:16S rRNA (guanine1207-N2)-methyltransferase